MQGKIFAIKVQLTYNYAGNAGNCNFILYFKTLQFN
jgi:hypothetical protein